MTFSFKTYLLAGETLRHHASMVPACGGLGQLAEKKSTSYQTRCLDNKTFNHATPIVAAAIVVVGAIVVALSSITSIQANRAANAIAGEALGRHCACLINNPSHFLHICKPTSSYSSSCPHKKTSSPCSCSSACSPPPPSPSADAASLHQQGQHWASSRNPRKREEKEDLFLTDFPKWDIATQNLGVVSGAANCKHLNQFFAATTVECNGIERLVKIHKP